MEGQHQEVSAEVRRQRLIAHFEAFSLEQLKKKQAIYERLLAEAYGRVATKTIRMYWMIEPWEYGLNLLNEVIEKKQQHEKHIEDIQDA